MKLVEMNWNPSDRQLRQFGLIGLVALPLIGWLWFGESATAVNLTAVVVSTAIGVVLAGLGLLCPGVLKPVFVALMLIAIPIGTVISEVALGLVFFGLFVPLGLVFRLIGRDVLDLKFDPEATTYWRPKKGPTDAAGYLRQS